MINNAFGGPSQTSLGDLLDIFGDDPGTEFFGGLFDHRPNGFAAVHRQNLQNIHTNANWMARQLDTAARRVLLTARHEVSVRHFEVLAAEMDTVRRLKERTETLAPDATAAESNAVASKVNAWTRRVQALVAASDDEHTREVWADAFTRLYAMHHRAFEHHIAHMLIFDGFVVERWNGGAGDLAADVIARLPAPDGRRVVVQCKHVQDSDTTIGSGVIQQVAGTRQLHEAELAFVVTTGKFTKPATALAGKLGVQLADCDTMVQWTMGGERLLDLFVETGQLPKPAAVSPTARPEGPVPPGATDVDAVAGATVTA
ncbi:restriction endonuclease [Streptomyces sp. NPDC127051]|uniref:restriction endonuclease n=1 Tax=Streptomyces sp. NPDC127051 TaxID=3347119 RepID=UPI0036540CB5